MTSPDQPNPAVSARECRIFWDYYGPTAHQTARHFERHLDEWITRVVREGEDEHACPPRLIGVDQYSSTHSAAYCVLPVEFGRVVYTALRAHRAVEETAPDLDK